MDADPTAPPTADEEWALEHFDAESRNMVRFRLLSYPCRVGRQSGLELPLLSPSISSRHAEITRADGGLLLTDLGSTNGTFVNQERITRPVALAEGDTVHFASLEFRLVRLGVVATASRRIEALSTMSIQADLGSLIHDAEQLQRVLDERSVKAVFQPIVDLRSGDTVALEALGRGLATEVPPSPYELFEIAAAIGRERELSRLFRTVAADEVWEAGIGLPLFVNIHPAELVGDELLNELRELDGQRPGFNLVLEISEQYAGRPADLRSLRSDLDALGLRLAYDDFGAGLARINELAEAPAHFLKFDAALVTGIDRAGDAKRRLVRALVAAARDLGMATLAEGIESPAEAEVCRDLGFELGQGFHFGRPAPLADERP